MASPRSNGGMSEPQASAAEAEQEAVPQVLFRAGKKRKAYRQREHDNGDGVAVVVDDHSDRATSEQLVSPLVDVHSATRQATISPVAPGCTPSRRNSDDGGRRKDEESADDDEENEEEAGLSVAELLRRRNARRAAARLRGVEFRPDSAGGVTSALSPTSGDDDGGRTLVVPPGGSEELRSPGLVAVDGSGPGGIPLAKQFAHQTGMVSQVVNKHMEQYIESELARRHAAERLGQQQQQSATGASTGHDSEATSSAIRAGDLHDKGAGLLPAMQGKLHEVDLGEAARRRNVALTEKAWRRMEGDEDVTEEDVDGGTANGSSKRARLGRDGKPRPPPRGLKRRGSEDIERDKAVEEILREARPPDVYATPQPMLQSSVGDDDRAAAGQDEDDGGAADDRIAEQFRREFLEAIAQRQRRRTAPINRPKVRKERNEDVLRGPKLGGSRNIRAQMRDILLAQEKEKRR